MIDFIIDVTFLSRMYLVPNSYGTFSRFPFLSLVLIFLLHDNFKSYGVMLHSQARIFLESSVKKKKIIKGSPRGLHFINNMFIICNYKCRLIQIEVDYLFGNY